MTRHDLSVHVELIAARSLHNEADRRNAAIFSVK